MGTQSKANSRRTSQLDPFAGEQECRKSSSGLLVQRLFSRGPIGDIVATSNRVIALATLKPLRD